MLSTPYNLSPSCKAGSGNLKVDCRCCSGAFVTNINITWCTEGSMRISVAVLLLNCKA